MTWLVQLLRDNSLLFGFAVLALGFLFVLGCCLNHGGE